MLSDERTLNNINPFVTGGPGAWRKPFGYAPCAAIEEPGTWDPPQQKDLCDWGINAQSNGSFLSENCRDPKNPVSCLIDRPLEPTRDIVPDLYTEIPYKEPIPEALRAIETQETVSNWFVPAAIFLLFALILLFRRLGR